MPETVKMKNLIKFKVECAICCENFSSTTTTLTTPLLLENCGHSICKNCYNEIKSTGSFKCPFCKIVSDPRLNTSLIELLEHGYLTCSGCYYPVKTKIKECSFTKKGELCFFCSENLKNQGLKNYSIISALENNKNNNKGICKLGKEDCEKKYDLKVFGTVCDCDKNVKKENLFSNFFKTSNLFEKEKYEKVVQKVYDDSKTLYERNKTNDNSTFKIKELISFKKNISESLEKIKESWDNFVLSNLKFLENMDLIDDLDRKSKKFSEDLFFKIKTDSENFSKNDINSLFETVENNKVLENFGNRLYIKNETGDNFNELNFIDSLTTFNNKISLLNKSIMKFLKRFQTKDTKKQKKTNFLYKTHPFLNLNPMKVI